MIRFTPPDIGNNFEIFSTYIQTLEAQSSHKRRGVNVNPKPNFPIGWKMCWYEVGKFLELDFFEFTVQFLQGHTKAAMCLGEVELEGE